MNKNLLLMTDVYKLNHMLLYAPGTKKVYSYLCARSNKNYNQTLFFGLQYYIEEYLTREITREDANEFYRIYERMLGPVPELVRTKVDALVELGYIPLQIKAVEEGTILPVKNVLMTMTNTHDDFPWVVGFFESLILKLWYPITVATTCMEYRKVVNDAFNRTVDPDQYFLKDFTVHDFGYRGDTSEEGAGISGAAHLLSFTGSDCIPAFPFVEDYYFANQDEFIMGSIPASEHSVMCSYGREGEKDAFLRILEVFPTGLVGIVSDTYNIWDVLTKLLPSIKDKILARDGKLVVRPDSGNPIDIICGTKQFIDPNAPNTPEELGCIRLLDREFGHTVNSKGFKVLNARVGLIYGDGMYLQRYKDTLAKLEAMGYAASNLVIGVGGILRNHTRDTLGFAIKATYVEVGDEERNIEKDPITDPGKKSHKGLLALYKDERGNLTTKDQCSHEEEATGHLRTVYKNGIRFRETDLAEIRARVRAQLI